MIDGFSLHTFDTIHFYKYTAVIIEPRQHPALEFVLQNFNDNLSQEWQFVVFHGTQNKEYTETICKKIFQPDRIKLVNMGVENLTISDYSGMFYKSLLYDNIPTEIFLIFQTDSVICSNHKDLINNFLKYDYVGAPWDQGGVKNVGNGGLSLRRKSKMLEIVEKCDKHMDGVNEDLIFSRGCGVTELNKPSVDEAKKFSIESLDNEKSFGIHKAYAYLDANKIGTWCPEITELKKLNT